MQAKETMERTHAEAVAQFQAQLESAKKQNLDLIEKSQELETELEKSRRKYGSKYQYDCNSFFIQTVLYVLLRF